ncbi:hypothetical protein JF66_11185 [Cryobacterium sp. MLB-32]|nr:hypothetical protein JF66_11185 [Cryobacterium sp. MLB-32]
MFSAFRSTTDLRLIGWAAFRENVRAGALAGAVAGSPAGNLAGSMAGPSGPAVAEAQSRGSRPGRPARDGSTLARAHSGIWRVLASNNRELGRSASVYGSFAGARAHVLELKDLVDDMVAETVTGPTAGAHGWIVRVGDRVVMTSGRWYGGPSSSREASVGAILAFRTAIVAEGARPSAEGGRRSRAESDDEKSLSW